MKIIRNRALPYKMYGPIVYMAAQKKTIRLARKKGDFDAECEALCKATTGWADAIVKHFKMDISVKGDENIPDKGPIVIVSNHQGYADIPVIMHIFRKLPLSFVAKKMMGALPFYGTWMKKYQRCVLIDQVNTRSAAATLRSGKKLLEEGLSMVVFPEGHRSKSGMHGEFKRGSFHLATELGLPILPISINGSYNVYEKLGYEQPASISVTIHPIERTDKLDRKQRDVIIKRVQEKIISELDVQNTDSEKIISESEVQDTCSEKMISEPDFQSID